MKKIFLLLILIGCCFTSSFAQKEKFFSLEANVNAKYFFSYERSILSNTNYEFSIIPAFTLDRWKFGLGVSYANTTLNKFFSANSIKGYSLNYINIPINVSFNFCRNNSNLWLNCFGEVVINSLTSAKMYNLYPSEDLKELEKSSSEPPIALYLRFGFEVSLLTFNNVIVNLSPFLNYNLYGHLENFKNISLKSTSDISFGISLGVEYMFNNILTAKK
ncbi:MAG: hypothetical protein LBM96_12690 [Methanobrevibacter sp.]|jgi:hypothetical protein|nr:hypothetical protein [Candidatus Methanoflexus mossambicus]